MSRPFPFITATKATFSADQVVLTLDKPLNQVGFKRFFLVRISEDLFCEPLDFPAADLRVVFVDADDVAYDVMDAQGDYLRLDALLQAPWLNAMYEVFHAYLSNDPLHVSILEKLPQSEFNA